MKISTTKQYQQVAKAMHKAGYHAKDVYPILENAGFSVELDEDTIYEGVYATKVMRLMYLLEEADLVEVPAPVLERLKL